ncbi:MAG TPA: tricarballylate utilization 4Fe-4S protein TcuB [Casimicrobiaceae bacterium]|nr:tricarballylate utilization 4Fe-4S protein TcuB [Casimicrobiaceae bacterium]
MPPDAIAPELVTEGARMARICNACRYCEGYCAVFPALERRLDFVEGDLTYLANLCHNCGACYYACQYAPPHDFAVNFPRMLADVRAASYRKYAWPDALARLFERNGVVVSTVTALMLALFLVATGYAAGGNAFFAPHDDAQGAFYAVLPHAAMAWSFGVVFAIAIIVLAIGAARFWRDTEELPRDFARTAPLLEATADTLALTYLDGGGDGCTYPDEQPSSLRRVFHHFTFYGFLLCFAATCAGTVYHYVLDRPAPYPFASLPVLLGTLGGIGLVIGPLGLLWLKAQRDRALTSEAQGGMDYAFLVLLLLVSVTGLLLLPLRETGAMGVLLAVHLGTVMALFLTMPYGKFVHAIYRFAALVRFHLERKRPLPGLGAE